MADLVTYEEFIELWLAWLEEHPDLVDPWTLDQPARCELAKHYVHRFLEDLPQPHPRKLSPTNRIIEYYRFRPEDNP